MDLDWLAKGACKSLTSEQASDIFFPYEQDIAQARPIIQRAKQICDSCEVKPACQEYGLRLPYGTEGIIGGLTLRERENIKRRRRKSA